MVKQTNTKDYLDCLNFDLIAEAIETVRENEKPLATYDAEDARVLVWNALERWLESDVKDLLITHVEQKVWVPIPGAPAAVTGVLDMQGQIRGLEKETKPFSGGRIIVDWKTTGGKLDTTWKNRLLDSFQWRLYSYFLGAKLFNYRGISRDGETRNLLIEVPETNDEEVIEYLSGASKMMGGLISSDLEVWPRHMPYACNAYNRECPFYNDCRDYEAIPKMPVRFLERFKNGVIELSFTRLERFLLCPEKERRALVDKDSLETDETNFGSSVHRGLAAAYKQVAEMFMSGLFGEVYE